MSDQLPLDAPEARTWAVDGPTLLEDVPEATYHAGGVRTPGPQTSQSALKKLIPPSTPAEFQWSLLHPEAPRRAFDVGTAAHTLVLGRGAEFVACPEDHLSTNRQMTTNKAKDWAAVQRELGRTPLHPDDYEAVHRMAESILNHPRAAELVTDPDRLPEASAFCEITPGLWLRARFDLLGGGLVDFKTAADSHADAFARSAWTYGYHVQSVAYANSWHIVSGADPAPMTFIVVGKEPPHLVGIYTLDDQFLSAGARQFEQALNTYIDQWERHGAPTAPDVVWDGLPSQTVTLSPPRWAARDLDAADAADVLDDLERILHS
ncbi:MAG: PD-(D/E)XK nuclease-like domain-containing protein [Propionibacteriaceae bacterium]|nr:PD-(D/E)XK nuclease-like domain-containing protein [Propionibacteriaceae bacterium]